MAAERRLPHDNEARSLKMLDDPLGGDLRHVLVGLMHPLFAAIAQGESDCLSKVVRVSGSERVVVGHCARIAAEPEHSKNGGRDKRTGDKDKELWQFAPIGRTTKLPGTERQGVGLGATEMTDTEGDPHKTIARWTGAVAFFTFVLACATIASSYYISGQLSAMTNAQNDAREQLRAYVTYEGGSQIINDKAGETINYIFAPIFHNWGGTRTSKFLGWASVHYFPGTVPNSQDFSKPFDAITNYNTTLGANSAQPIPVSLPAPDAIKAKNNEGIVVIWGHADWADIYHPENVYPVSFCFTLKPVSSDGDNHIIFQPVPYKPECNTGMSDEEYRQSQKMR